MQAFERLLDPGIIAVIVSVLAAVIVVVAVLLIRLWTSREQRYDRDKQIAVIEDMRRSLEDKVYELTRRQLATEDRWRDTNHLILSAQRQQESEPSYRGKAELSGFFRRAGILTSDERVDQDMAFVLVPFHPEFMETFLTVSHVCRDAGLKCLRGDEDYYDDVQPEILRLMVQARIIIAVIDGRNPNVFYELGIAHAIDKPVIIISRSVESLPIDVRSKYMVLYDDLSDLEHKLRDQLLKVFRGLSDDETTPN